MLAIDRDLAEFRRAVALSEKLTGVAASLWIMFGRGDRGEIRRAGHFTAGFDMDDLWRPKQTKPSAPPSRILVTLRH
ncbi:hypothetical protein [Nakamurella sp. GG22]